MRLVTEGNITELAEARWGNAHNPRLGVIMPVLVRHLHDFARDVGLTVSEWSAGLSWLARAGQLCDDKRDEMILASDVLGLSMLVVQLNHHTEDGVTPATVLGPFYVEGSPELEDGANMAVGVPGTPLYITGSVREVGGTGVAGAVLDVWQADAEGAYEAQLGADEARLRAHHRAIGLRHPDGRPRGRTAGADRHQSLPSGAHPLPARRTRL